MPRHEVLCNTPHGLYCPAGDFYIDPWRSVPNAVITHAHSDHARPGMGHYLAHKHTVPLLRLRLGETIHARSVEYGEHIRFNDAIVSMHPAGHVIGSAQIRIEVDGEVWVVSGDYKRQSDPFAAPFEIVPCDVFITESTFGVPVYRWPTNEQLSAEMSTWWRSNAERGIASVVFAYSLGKAQRVMGSLDTSIGPIYTHRSIENMNTVIRQMGIPLPQSQHLDETVDTGLLRGSLIITPGSSDAIPAMRRAAPFTTAAASGWMALRGNRRRFASDKGFVMSDHVDWPDLVQTIKDTGAKRIFVTHGYSAIFVRWLCEQGYDARELHTLSSLDEVVG